jgi:hypothetical protein
LHHTFHRFFLRLTIPKTTKASSKDAAEQTPNEMRATVVNLRLKLMLFLNLAEEENKHAESDEADCFIIVKVGNKPLCTDRVDCLQQLAL